MWVGGIVLSALAALHQVSTVLSHDAISQPERNAVIAANLIRSKQIQEKSERLRWSANQSNAELFHGLLQYGRDFDITDEDGRTRSCLAELLDRRTSGQWGRQLPTLMLAESGWLFQEDHDLPYRSRPHYGQYVWYMIVSGLGADQSIATPDRSGTTLAQVAKALVLEAPDGIETSYVLPVALWISNDTWTNRYGQVVSIRDLVGKHLEQSTSAFLCFGMHWYQAVEVASRPQFLPLIGRSMQRHCRVRLGQRAAELLAEALPCGQLRYAGPLNRQQQLSFQAHALEWMLAADIRMDELRLHTCVQYLLAELEALWENLPRPYVAHAIRALCAYEKRFGIAGTSS